MIIISCSVFLLRRIVRALLKLVRSVAITQPALDKDFIVNRPCVGLDRRPCRSDLPARPPATVRRIVTWFLGVSLLNIVVTHVARLLRFEFCVFLLLLFFLVQSYKINNVVSAIYRTFLLIFFWKIFCTAEWGTVLFLFLTSLNLDPIFVGASPMGGAMDENKVSPVSTSTLSVEKRKVRKEII